MLQTRILFQQLLYMKDVKLAVSMTTGRFRQGTLSNPQRTCLFLLILVN